MLYLQSRLRIAMIEVYLQSHVLVFCNDIFAIPFICVLQRDSFFCRLSRWFTGLRVYNSSTSVVRERCTALRYYSVGCTALLPLFINANFCEASHLSCSMRSSTMPTWCPGICHPPKTESEKKKTYADQSHGIEV